MLFIAGQISRHFDGDTGVVGQDEYEQTKQKVLRIQRIVKAAGGTMDNLVKLTICVVNIEKNTEL